MSEQQPATAEEVADLLAQIAEASALLASAVDRIACTPRPDRATIERLREIAEQLEPGARARDRLAGVDSLLLIRGAELYRDRRRDGVAGPGRCA